MYFSFTRGFATQFKVFLKAEYAGAPLMCRVLFLQDDISDSLPGDKRGNNPIRFHILSHIQMSFVLIKREERERWEGEKEERGRKDERKK